MNGHKITPEEDYNEILGPVWSGESMKPYINEGKLEPEQIQPNGIDLTADKVFVVVDGSVLSSVRDLNQKGDLIMQHNGHLHGLRKPGWFLSPGYYLIEWTEVVRIPDNAIGLISPRSTLVRIGGWICGAVWDRGYHGKGRSGLVLYNHLLFEQGTRLAQMIFINATKTGRTYDGQYQHEQLNQDATKKEK